MVSEKSSAVLTLRSGKSTTVNIKNDSACIDNAGNVNWDITLEFDSTLLSFSRFKQEGAGKNFNIIAHFDERQTDSGSYSGQVTIAKADLQSISELEILVSGGASEATGTTPRRIRRIVEVSQC